MGIVVNHELDLTEVRVESFYDLVDVFIISEGNLTTSIS